MGTNESWLSLALGEASDIDRVEDAIISSYESRGAKLVKREHDPTLERLGTFGRGSKLGVAIIRSMPGV